MYKVIFTRQVTDTLQLEFKYKDSDSAYSKFHELAKEEPGFLSFVGGTTQIMLMSKANILSCVTISGNRKMIEI